MPNLEAAVKQIEHHWHCLLITRSRTPHLESSMAGLSVVRTAPYYRRKGYDATVHFATPITDLQISDMNLASHWVNQSFIVRLYGILESHKIFTKEGPHTDTSLAAHQEIRLVKTLRNCFAHGEFKYDSQNSKHEKAYEQIVQLYRIAPPDRPETSGLFPIPIDKVLKPLKDACQSFLKALAVKHGQHTI